MVGVFFCTQFHFIIEPSNIVFLRIFLKILIFFCPTSRSDEKIKNSVQQTKDISKKDRINKIILLSLLALEFWQFSVFFSHKRGGGGGGGERCIFIACISSFSCNKHSLN